MWSPLGARRLPLLLAMVCVFAAPVAGSGAAFAAGFTSRHALARPTKDRVSKDGVSKDGAKVQDAQPSAATTTVARAPMAADRGIVQTVAEDSLVLRALDGSSIVVTIDARTKFYVGGRSASVADVQPGGVATVRHQGSAPAIDVRVDLPPKPRLRNDRGLTDTVSPTSLVVQLADGTSATVRVDATTRVYGANGRQVSIGDLRPGRLVDIVYDPSGALPAQSVKIVRR